MEIVNFLNIAPFSGKRVSKFEGEKRYLSTGGLIGDNLEFENVSYINRPSRADIEVLEGDVLFARMKNTNKVLYVDSSLSGIIVSTGFSVHRTAEYIDKQYIIQILKHNLFIRQKDKYCTGAIQPAITNSGIKKIKIPIPYKDSKPDLLTQKRIAKVLSSAEKLIAKRKESIALLDEFLKSTFGEMFGDNLSSNKKDWITLGDLITTLTDYHSNGSYKILNANISIKNKPDYALMVRTKDLESNDFENDCIYINEKEYNFLKKSKVFGGEIIITKIGSVGNVYLMPYLNRPVSLGMNAFLLRFNEKTNSIFIYYFLKSQYGKSSIMKKVKGAVTKTITKDAVRSIVLPEIPFLLQNQFAEIVEKTEAIKEKFQESLSELENLYGSLSQKAFKGELDLIKVEIEVTEKLEQREEIMDKEIKREKIKELDVLRFIKEKYNNDTFSFEELQQKIDEVDFEYTYDKIKDIIFQSIDKEIVEQTFDEQTGSVKLRLK